MNAASWPRWAFGGIRVQTWVLYRQELAEVVFFKVAERRGLKRTNSAVVHSMCKGNIHAANNILYQATPRTLPRGDKFDGWGSN